MDLFKFLAMFGPDKTAMLKIASLLLCSNNNGNWLTFETPTDPSQIPMLTGAPLAGSFDIQEPNCLILRYPTVIKRIWNNPNVDAYGSYLTDERGNRYQSWDKVFEQAPIHSFNQDMTFGQGI